MISTVPGGLIDPFSITQRKLSIYKPANKAAWRTRQCRNILRKLIRLPLSYGLKDGKIKGKSIKIGKQMDCFLKTTLRNGNDINNFPVATQSHKSQIIAQRS